MNHPPPLQSGLKNSDNPNGFNQGTFKIDVKFYFSLSVDRHPVILAVHFSTAPSLLKCFVGILHQIDVKINLMFQD